MMHLRERAEGGEEGRGGGWECIILAESRAILTEQSGDLLQIRGRPRFLPEKCT